MTDREKVIRGLESLYKSMHENQCYACSHEFIETAEEFGTNIIADAIELLKEQEAVKPLAKEDDSYECICGAIVGWDELDASGIVKTRLNYCPFCGRMVKWG